jgi:hypothetical protein
VAGVYIYDQSSAPGGLVTLTGILAYLEERLQLARSFRERVVRATHQAKQFAEAIGARNLTEFSQ